MANMRVVNTEWTGSCVIACDCGSEEPVEGTVHSVASGVLENEIKRLRGENSELKDQCLELRKMSAMTADELREDYLKLGEVMDELSNLKSNSRDRLEEINQLRIQLKALKELWVTEYLNRNKDNE